MTEVVLDDTDLVPVVLVVTFADREERWGPYTTRTADFVMETFRDTPPEGFKSARLETQP